MSIQYPSKIIIHLSHYRCVQQSLCCMLAMETDLGSGYTNEICMLLLIGGERIVLDTRKLAEKWFSAVFWVNFSVGGTQKQLAIYSFIVQ